jgi:hypothetical protein
MNAAGIGTTAATIVTKAGLIAGHRTVAGRTTRSKTAFANRILADNSELEFDVEAAFLAASSLLWLPLPVGSPAH